MKYLPFHMLDSVPKDIVTETETGVYVGRYDREKVDYKSGIDLTEQPIWSITFYEISTTNESTITRTLFPKGSLQSRFKWSDRDSLTYEFMK